jgi:hypothetical protein
MDGSSGSSGSSGITPIIPCDPCDPRKPTVDADLSGSARTGYSFPSPTAPTASYDYDGVDPLYTGSFYYNTASGSMYIWNGLNWIDGFGSSGTSGTSGISGTGFNTINNAGSGRLLVSDGTTNAATASSNLNYDTNTFYMTGSVVISGSQTDAIYLRSLRNASNADTFLYYSIGSKDIAYRTRKYTNTIGNNIDNPITVVHALNDVYPMITLKENSSGNIYYPETGATGALPYTATVVDNNTISLLFNTTPTPGQYDVIVII